MVHYETLGGLRKAVERLYGQTLKDETWEMLKPDYAPPYDEFDLKEALQNLPDYKPEERKGRQSWKVQWNVWLPPELSFRSPSVAVKKLLPRMRDYRTRMLRLVEPVPIVPLEKLKAKLLELGATERPGGIPLAYPKGWHIGGIEGTSRYFNLWDIDYVRVPLKISHKLYFLPNMVSTLSWYLGCHPAMSLIFILCDVPPSSFAPTIIRDGSKINIQVPYPEISPKIVSQTYSAVRNIIIKEERRVQGKWARPREQTQRVKELLFFIGDNLAISWKQRLGKWNAENPQWAYANLHSMQVTVYRASKKL